MKHDKKSLKKKRFGIYFQTSGARNLLFLFNTRKYDSLL